MIAHFGTTVVLILGQGLFPEFNFMLGCATALCHRVVHVCVFKLCTEQFVEDVCAKWTKFMLWLSKLMKSSSKK